MSKGRRQSRELTAFQVLARICWRTDEAVRMFSGRNAETLWNNALAGNYPFGLGDPKVAPAEAERQVTEAMRSGALSYRVGPERRPKSKFHSLAPGEAIRRMEQGRSDEVWIKLSEVAKAFGLSKEQMLKYLQLGVLRVHGTPFKKNDPTQGYYDLAVRADALVEFMAETGLRPLNS